jgi:hypothetical protein
MTTSHNGMEKYDIDDVPTGVFWYREEYKPANKQQVVWTRWDVVYVHDREYRGKLRRHLSSQFWSSNADDTRRKLDKGGFVCEFYQIPLPPGHPDEDKGQTQEPAGEGVREISDPPGPK